MTYKKVKVNGDVPIEKPEDWFNELIEDGFFSVGEALANIISYSIVISKVNDLIEDIEDNEDLYPGGFHSPNNDGMFIVGIEKEE